MEMKHPLYSYVRTGMRGIFLLAFLIILASCDNSENNPVAKVDLIFQLQYDGEPLAGPNQVYELNDSVELQFSKVSFYLSDFKLSDGSQTYPLWDVLHISFLQDINGDAIAETQQKLTFEIPSGNYESLSFGLGLHPTLNGTTPTEHEVGSALSFSSEYWPAWQSYIFEKIEGAYKVNGGQLESVALHVGGDDTYRVLDWTSGLSIGDGEVKVINIPIDLKHILDGYPITESPVLHQLEQLPLMEMIADRFVSSMN